MRSMSTSALAAADLVDPRGVALIAAEKLQGSPYAGIKGISCHFREGVLTLRGTAPTCHMKLLAKSISSMVEGVEGIVDRVHVVKPTLESSLETNDERTMYLTGHDPTTKPREGRVQCRTPAN